MSCHALRQLAQRRSTSCLSLRSNSSDSSIFLAMNASSSACACLRALSEMDCANELRWANIGSAGVKGGGRKSGVEDDILGYTGLVTGGAADT
jgi:hypothetical protein